MSLSEFLQSEDGLVTVDWTVLLAGLTAAGLAMSAVLTQSLGTHTGEIRGELQDPHFETDWVETVEMPQQ
jgi:hypothetical protein